MLRQGNKALCLPGCCNPVNFPLADTAQKKCLVIGRKRNSFEQKVLVGKRKCDRCFAQRDTIPAKTPCYS